MNDDLAYYQQLVEENPQHADTRLHLVAILHHVGQHDQAVYHAIEAARVLAHQGDVVRAVEVCNQVLALAPHYTDAQLLMASLYARLPTTGTSRGLAVISAPHQEPEEEEEVLLLLPKDAVQELGATDLEVIPEQQPLAASQTLGRRSTPLAAALASARSISDTQSSTEVQVLDDDDLMEIVVDESSMDEFQAAAKPVSPSSQGASEVQIQHNMYPPPDGAGFLYDDAGDETQIIDPALLHGEISAQGDDAHSAPGNADGFEELAVLLRESLHARTVEGSTTVEEVEEEVEETTGEFFGRLDLEEEVTGEFLSQPEPPTIDAGALDMDLDLSLSSDMPLEPSDGVHDAQTVSRPALTRPGKLNSNLSSPRFRANKTPSQLPNSNVDPRPRYEASRLRSLGSSLRKKKVRQEQGFDPATIVGQRPDLIASTRASLEETTQVAPLITADRDVTVVGRRPDLIKALRRNEEPSFPGAILFEGKRQEETVVTQNFDLPETPLLSRLPEDIRQQVVQRMIVRRAAPNQVIIHEGVHHRRLFIVMSGTVRVERPLAAGSKVLAKMSRGEFFGEFELLTQRPPKARVCADEHAVLMEISHEVIFELGHADPSVWNVLWDFYHERLLSNLLAGSSLFGSLPEKEREDLKEQFQYGKVEAKTVIIRQGEPAAGLYLVLNGEAVVSHQNQARKSDVATLREGDFFGTVSSMTQAPVTATVCSVVETTLLFLPRDNLQALIDRYPEVGTALRRLVAYRQIVVGKTGYSRMGMPK